LVIFIVSLLLTTVEASQFYAMIPPMSQCGLVPHPVPHTVQALVSQIQNTPKYIAFENRTNFQYSVDSMSTEQYHNGSTYNVQYVTFVHVISNSIEDVITVSILPDSTMNYSVDFNSAVFCTSAGAIPD